MNFDKFFKLISFALVFCGFLSLWISGSFGFIVTILFLLTFISAWLLDSTGWEIPERLGTALTVIMVPLFYVGWKYQLFGIGGNGVVLAGILAKLILLLTGIKLLQKKADRDWIFLYLMSFFQVLLAAGMSISPLYLASMILYLLVAVCAVIAFEIRKTSNLVNEKLNENTKKTDQVNLKKLPKRRLPTTAFSLLLLIIVLATPLFFAFPRVGGAGFGSNLNNGSAVTGFSDTVKLGEIGRLKLNDQILMRARIEKTDGKNLGSLKWRGIALDYFDNKTWRKSRLGSSEPFVKGDKDFFLIDAPAKTDDLTVQTIYLEPLENPMLFALSRPVAVQGSFQILKKDSEGALSLIKSEYERLSYKVYSDRTLPEIEDLKKDDTDYSTESNRYLLLPPKFDERITQLAVQLTENEVNRYDKAKAVETYLQNNLGYTLDLKAGGEEPLSDFLFNVREGHCEYFATAMAVMLRTQGIATRIVNGLQQGEYNETAGAYIVRQRDAHSWVEVYFPGQKAWIPFDPTPFAGQFSEVENAGVVGRFNKYLEALETFWVQYFVAYDNQEQRSLFRSVKSGFQDFQSKSSVWLSGFQDYLSDWWKTVRGDSGLQASARAVAMGIAYLLAALLGIYILYWLYRKIINLTFWEKLINWLKRKNEATIIEFYERMQKVLANQGFRREPHQTPLEFAFALKMPEAVLITEKYNRVRFGDKILSKNEAEDIDNWLKELEKKGE